MYKIFIDGEHGTTGLQIHQQLKSLDDIQIISLSVTDYKNLAARIELAKQSDLVILCLPDDAAYEMVKALDKYKLRIIDCSTAFRVDENWVYGFAELTKGQTHSIQNAQYVSNPGCYPTGALSLIRPLRDSNIMSAEMFLTIYAVSGYSGGGKTLIKEMKDINTAAAYFAYGLDLAHKHNAEIKKYSNLKHMPVFLPNVANFPQGMLVNIGFHLEALNEKVTLEDIYNVFQEHYDDKEHIIIANYNEPMQRLEPASFADSNKLTIYIFGNKENGTVNLCAALDNLGKGASGAAIQNLKLMLNI